MENEKKKTGLATAAFVLSIIGSILSFIPILNNIAPVFGALAIIFGIICLIKKKSIGFAVTSLILGVICIAITFSLQAKWSKALNDVSDNLSQIGSDAEKSLDNISGDNTDEILNNSLDAEIGEFVYDDTGVFTETSLPVHVKNKCDEAKSFSIMIEAVTEDGARIDEDTVYVNSLGSGQEQDLKAFELVSSEKSEQMKTAVFKIVKVSMY